jgi:hypothetical protein
LSWTLWLLGDPEPAVAMMAEALALAEPAFHAHSRDCRSGRGHFEVVHAVEHARDRYFAKLALGLPADLCKRHALGAFTI